MLFFYKSYKNSIFATLLSMIGGLFVSFGILGLIVAIATQDPEGFEAFIVCGLIGVVFGWLGKHIAKKKQFKELVKTIKEKNCEGQISASVDFALSIYKGCPTSYVEKYISDLNPQAGEVIKQSKNKSGAK